MIEDPTPPKGTRTGDELPMRRLTDKVICPHPDPHKKAFRGSFGAPVLLHYLVSSAAIAVLVLVFHVWRTIKHIDETVAKAVVDIVSQNIEQTREMKNIHESIHAEARTLQAEKGKKK